MKDVTAWPAAVDCWRGYRTGSYRITFGCWGLQWQPWPFSCCWDTKDEQQLSPELSISQHPYVVAFCGRNCSIACRTVCRAPDRRHFRDRGGCLYRMALVAFPTCDDGHAAGGSTCDGAVDRSFLPRRPGWAEPADAGRLIDHGAHGRRCLVEQSETRPGLFFFSAFSRDRAVRHLYRAQLSPLVPVLGVEPDSGVLPHPHVGRAGPCARGDPVLHIHHGRQHNAAALVSGYLSGQRQLRFSGAEPDGAEWPTGCRHRPEPSLATVGQRPHHHVFVLRCVPGIRG